MDLLGQHLIKLLDLVIEKTGKSMNDMAHSLNITVSKSGHKSETVLSFRFLSTLIQPLSTYSSGRDGAWNSNVHTDHLGIVFDEVASLLNGTGAL